MKVAKPTREERERQLLELCRTPEGWSAVYVLYLACFPLGQVPVRGSMIPTVLDSEYPKSAEPADG